MVGGMGGRGACMAGGHVWQWGGACVAEGMCMAGGGMHGRGAFMVGEGMHDRGCVWQGDMHGRYYEIQSMSGQYASYWNVFLLKLCLPRMKYLKWGYLYIM